MASRPAGGVVVDLVPGQADEGVVAPVVEAVSGPQFGIVRQRGEAVVGPLLPSRLIIGARSR
jgi:hypothetical protein